MAEDNATPTKKNVYISLHKSFIHENIKYTDRKTGEEKTFNVVRLPKDTVIDGKDMGGFEFSPSTSTPRSSGARTGATSRCSPTARCSCAATCATSRATPSWATTASARRRS